MDIELAKAMKRKINLGQLRKEIDKPWVKTKIENHLERNPHLDMTAEDVSKRILEDDLIASFFAKDPSKQNFSENMAVEVIENIKSIKSFDNYSTNTNIFLYNGKIVNERPDGYKNIDFKIEHKNGKVYYATQKYTHGSGGAQDNQFNDVLNFLKNTEGNNEFYFLAIVDGKYYTKEKLNILKKYEKDNVIVCSITEVEGIING